jgi:hypothetical protein
MLSRDLLWRCRESHRSWVLRTMQLRCSSRYPAACTWAQEPQLMTVSFGLTDRDTREVSNVRALSDGSMSMTPEDLQVCC